MIAFLAHIRQLAATIRGEWRFVLVVAALWIAGRVVWEWVG